MINRLSPSTRRLALYTVLAMICVTAAGAFSIVWMQQRINRTAARGKALESELAEVVRKLNYLDERIATLHQPVVLQGRVSGVLRPSTENQVVWVRERPTPGGRAYAASRPYETAVDLAFVSLRSKP